MLRIYFLQHWFNLSDPAVEEALYDMISMRAFARIDLGASGVPDETTICKFRHLIEKHDLGKSSSPRSIDIWPIAASRSAAGRSSTRRSSMHPVRRRTKMVSAIPRCIRLRRVINGSSG